MKETAVKTFQEEFDKYFGNSGALDIVADIMATRWILLGALGSAFLIGFLYMIVLRFFAKPIVYITLAAVVLGTAYGGWMLYDK